LAEDPRTIILYESPYKFIKTLSHICEYFGEERQISVSRELSKLFEETKRGIIKSVLEYYTNHPSKGENVIVVAGN
jgi:16S rRNA (cytidine1402-2'-O)-methyltransferase